jgi:ribosomal-protein-serine acetyltransferase
MSLSFRKQVLPSYVGCERDVVVRAWAVDDAAALGAAIDSSLEHLRPWMVFANEKLPTVAQRRERLAYWAKHRADGGDAIYGIFLGGAVAGSCGLHWRLEDGGIEIGYWVASAYLRRGVASTASRLLTDAAFTLEEIQFVEIHHDRANVASAGVPRTLGYTLLGEFPDGAQTPGESGIECRWRVTREQWAALALRARPGAGLR